MDQSSNDPSPNSRWNTVEMVKAFYGPEDCVSDIAEVKFDRPVPIKVSPAVLLFTVTELHTRLYIANWLSHYV